MRLAIISLGGLKMRLIKHALKTWLLWELVKGLALTMRYFFKKSITVEYPEERTPYRRAFAGCMLCAVMTMAKSVVLLVSYAK